MRTRGDDTPVYDQHGALVAASVTGAAALLGCSRPTVYHCSEPYQDGRRLTRLPRQQRHGSAPRPVVLPDSHAPSIAAAARALGVTRQALYHRGSSGPDGELIVRPAHRQKGPQS